MARTKLPDCTTTGSGLRLQFKIAKENETKRNHRGACGTLLTVVAATLPFDAMNKSSSY